ASPDVECYASSDLLEDEILLLVDGPTSMPYVYPHMQKHPSRSYILALSTTAVVVMLGVTAGLQTAQPAAPKVRQSGPYTVTTVADGLDQPWSIAFLPDGSMLVTEIKGHVRVIRNGALDPNPVAGVPEVFAPPYAGLMDIVLHPDFAHNQFVYL